MMPVVVLSSVLGRKSDMVQNVSLLAMNTRPNLLLRNICKLNLKKPTAMRAVPANLPALPRGKHGTIWVWELTSHNCR
jgi:hypothetical protein